MARPRPLLVVGTIVILALLFVSISVSPLSRFDSGDHDLPDWIDDVYLHFDSLRTDLSDYRWPTDASHTMSSAFAEFRKTHFHAGIDISTRGRRGYRVFASRSGSIARIMVSPFGYGKMLQVRHEDGFITVYAHLQKFNDQLDRYVREQQYSTGQYAVDLRPEPGQFPVDQGEVIAYSGDTGVGPPHLHFEIRDERMNPVNPLLSPDFDSAVADTRFPEFVQLSFAPFDHTGRINGRPKALMVNVRARGKHRYSVPSTIRIAGPVGLSVKAVDRVNATWHRNGVYHYDVYLDSTLIFTSKLDRFPARESEQIALHFDWPMVLAGEGRFQKLYLEPGNRLPLYGRHPAGSGVLTPSDSTLGEHRLLIVARDIKGNASELTATVLFEELAPLEVRQIEERYVLLPSSGRDLRSITISSKPPGSRSWRRSTLDPARLPLTELGLELPIQQQSGLVIRIEGDHSDGAASYPLYFAPKIRKATDNSLSLEHEFARDYLLINVSSHLPFSLRPTLWLLNGEKKHLIDLHADDERRYLGTFPLASLEGGLVRLESEGSVNGVTVKSSREFPIFPITPENGGVIVAGDGEFSAEFPADGVYQPLYCRIEKTDRGYRITPDDILLHRGATIRYRVPAGLEEQSGLFFSHDGDLNLLSTKREGGVLVGKVSRFLGEFAVRQDTVPPRISSLSVRYSRGQLRIRCSVRDLLAGVDHQTIRLTVDDRLLIGTYDPYARTVIFDEPLALDPGSHVVRIECADKMGNSSSASQSFRTR